jgi:hypothetical protein
MKFKAYYYLPRFKYISEELHKKFNLDSKVRNSMGPDYKIGVFLADKFNFFIDTADGVNEDLGINEYCSRIIEVIQDYGNKPFLYLRINFSPKYSFDLVKMAEQHNGKVKGIFNWNFRNGYYDYLLSNADSLRKKARDFPKEFDTGFMGNLKPYFYPKPNAENPLVSWRDYEVHGLGSPQDTGFYEFNPRKTLYEKMKKHFKVYRGEDFPFEKYIDESFKWKLCFNAPGYGEYTTRAFLHSFLGQPVFFRKNTYDNPVSWKDYWPEIDFNSAGWPKELEKLVNNYREWGEKSLYYHTKYLTPQNIVNHIYEEVLKFEAGL